MDRNKITKKVAGSTIIEVLVSMVIIITVFGIGMMIYSNVLRHSVSEKRLLAESALQQIMTDYENHLNRSSASPDTETTAGGTYDPGNNTQTIHVGRFVVTEEASNFNGNPRLTEINLTAYDENQEKVADMKKIIYR